MEKQLAIENRRKEAIEEFKYILENYILPLLQYEGHLHLKCEVTQSSNLKKHIKHYSNAKGNFLYFFPSLSTPQFHFKLRTNNPEQELGAAEQILREMLRVSKFHYHTERFTSTNYYDKNNLYRNARFNVAFEIGLCNWLGSECIYELIERLRDWSQKTYEGNHMSFSFIVDASQQTTGEVDYLHFLKSNYSAVFTNGVTSGIKLDNKGRIVKYFSTIHGDIIDHQKHTTWTPYEFTDFANMCYSENGSNWVGVIMQSNGDLLIFKSKQLVFVKRNGKWLYLSSYDIHSTIMKQYHSVDDGTELEKKRFADAIFLSALDTSFAHTGGCIAIINDKHIDKVKQHCFPKDSFDTETVTEKIIVAKRLIKTGTLDEGKTYFQYLDRRLRLELMSLDGATVLDSSGKILCVGAIVKIDGGSDGGGRTAAAKELAKYGFSMKISMDGCIQCFTCNNECSEPIELLQIL